MKELSPKSAIFAVFCTVILGSCIPAGGAGIAEFVDKDDVKDYVEAIESVVKVIDLTGDNLKGRDRKIEGLKQNRYYMVQKETYPNPDDPDKEISVPGYPMYVTDYPNIGPGALWRELGLITTIKRETIFELVNKHTYTVIAAVPFGDGKLTYYENGQLPEVKQIIDGAVNIGDIKTATGYLSLSGIPAGTYEVIGVSLLSWMYQSKKLSNSDNFAIEGPNTTSDYVFVKNDTSEFSVLRVIVGNLSGPPIVITDKVITGVTAPATGGIPVSTITNTQQYTGIVKWTPTVNGTFAASTDYTAEITLTPKLGYTLTGVEENSFTVAGAKTTKNAANSGLIKATFQTTTALSKVNITLIIDWANPAKPILSPNNGIFTQADYYDGTEKTITIDFSNLNGYKVVKWVDDTGTTVAGAVNFFTLNNLSGDINYLSKGTHVITIVLEHPVTKIVHNLDFTLKVN